MNPIPRGNTQKGVNKEVYKLLQGLLSLEETQTLIDVPCGHLEMALFLKSHFPKLKVVGIDKHADNTVSGVVFHKNDAETVFRCENFQNIDVITCISGVMCFDDVEKLLGRFNSVLKSQGVLILTNDSYMTVRDRLHYFFFAHFKRFKLIPKASEGVWNVLFPQTLYFLLKRQNFDQIKIRYTSYYLEDIALFPIAIFIYLLFLPYLFAANGPLTLSERLMLFSWRMMFSRHYVISALKLN